MDLGYDRLLGALVVLALVVAGLLFSPATVAQRFHDVIFSPWFPVVLFALYAIRPFLAWPITVLAALVGYRYGILLGVPVALLGAAMSTFIPYAAVRYFDFESGLLGMASEQTERYFSELGDFRGLIAARVAPIPAEVTSLAAGAADVPPGMFVVGTIIGELPWAVAAVAVGHSMYRLSLSGVSYDLWLLVGTALAALLLVAGPAYRYFQGTADDEGAEDRTADAVD